MPGIGKSVAIKFDLYNDAGEGNDSTGVFTDGALPTVPAVDLTPSGIELNSGDSIQAHVTYDGTTLTMNLLDLVNNKTFTMSKVINIPQIVGANTAYVGFTGSTGGLTSSQKILTWTYTAGTAAGNIRANLLAGGRHLQHSSERRFEQFNGWLGDLLHDERYDADDGIHSLYGSDRGGCGYDDDQGDRRRGRIDQHGGDGDVSCGGVDSGEFR